MNIRPTQSRSEVAKWKMMTSKYQQPSFWRAGWQLLNTLGSYFLVWCAIFLSLGTSWWMNLAIVCMAGGLGSALGFANYLLVQLIIMMVAGSAGVWLFYVQHQFEGTYWARSGEWNYTAAALHRYPTTISSDAI